MSPRIYKRTERLGYWIYFCFHVKCLGGIYSDCFECKPFCSLECRPLLWISPTPFIWGWEQIQFPTCCVFYTRWWVKSNPKFSPLFPVGLFNPLNPELNPICCLLTLLGANHFLHVSRIKFKSLTLRLLMSYIYGAPILDVSRSHTTTHHSR